MPDQWGWLIIVALAGSVSALAGYITRLYSQMLAQAHADCAKLQSTVDEQNKVIYSTTATLASAVEILRRNEPPRGGGRGARST